MRFRFRLILAALLTSGLIAWAGLFASPAAPAQVGGAKATLIAEIQAYAERHARSGGVMQTQLVVNLFRDNTAGLTPKEIALAYEERFLELRDAPGPWDWLRPRIGWVVAVILFVLLVFRDILKEWATRAVQALGGLVYSRMAGSRLFRRLAIKKYRAALIQKYAKLHIPFRPNRPLEMREVYVPLQVSGDLEDKQIDAFRAVSDHRRLMVKGPPGSGKSMLLKHLALSYAEGFLDVLPDRPIPVLLELHRLSDPGATLEQHLVAELGRNGFPRAESFVRHNLEGGTLMLLLDGLDEVGTSQRGRVAREIQDLVEKYRSCRFVATCRSAIYRDEFAGVVNQTYDATEFEDQQIRRFLASWEPSMPEGKSIEQLLQTLADRPRILALARNPLLLTIIAYLYTDTAFVLPHSRAEFYETSTDVLLHQWHQEHNRYKAREKRLVLQQIALFLQGGAGQKPQDRRSAGFQEVLALVRQGLPDLNLKPEDAGPLLDEIVERSGLLLSIDGGVRYSFAHLTLQEFFAAQALAGDAADLLKRYRADRDSWREALKLWCGVAPDSTVVIGEIYGEDPITAFECLADAQKVDQGLADEIINQFKSRLGEKEHGDAILEAFAAVASDARPRGQEVFAFLNDNLNSHDPERRQAAAGALSRTNLPQAAEVLARASMDDPDFHRFLVRMGDLAIPGLLAQLESSRFQEALDGLRRLSTPRAARAIVPVLWHKRLDLAQLAAMNLGAMLATPGIEDALRTFDLARFQLESAPLEWIWEPFQESTSSNLPMIAARIALFLERAENLSPIAPIDPRLLLPLCAAHAAKDVDLSRLWNWKIRAEPEVRQALLALDLSVARASQNEHAVKASLQAVLEPGHPIPFDSLKSVLLPAIVKSPRWIGLFRGLEQGIQDDFLRRILKGPIPSRIDWLNVFTPLEYQFARGWYFRLFLLLFLVLSVGVGGSLAMNSERWLFDGWESIYWWIGGLGIVILAGLLSSLAISRSPGSHEGIEEYFLACLVLVFGPITLSWALLRDPIMDRSNLFWALSNLVLAFFAGLFFSAFGALIASPIIAMVYVTSSVHLGSFNPVEVAAFWIAIFCVGSALWVKGSRLDRTARNPLRGILVKPGSSLAPPFSRGTSRSLIQVLRRWSWRLSFPF